MPYQIADGANNEAGLASFDPQPATPGGIQYHETRWSGDGSANYAGFAYCDLVWNSLTRSQYNAILSLCGLSDAIASNVVTARIRLDNDTFANRNAVAIHLRNKQKRGMAFWKSLTIRLNKLEAVS